MTVCGCKPDRNKTFRESPKLRTDFNHEFPKQAFCQKQILQKKIVRGVR